MATDDFFRARLDQMIDLRHPLAVLARRMPWAQIETALAPALAHKNRDGNLTEGVDLFGPKAQLAGAGVSAAGRPRLPMRLMVSLLYLKHAYNLSDEELVERWGENVQWQFFSGQDYYEPRLPCDATQIGRFRSAIGEAGVEELLKATIDAAVSTKAIRTSEFERVIVDTTVQVRREVAYIIVSPAHKAGDETGCSVSRSLPVHASLAMVSCEAMGTKRRAFGPRHLPRGRGVTCEHQRGRGARLSDRVNTCELPQASL